MLTQSSCSLGQLGVGDVLPAALLLWSWAVCSHNQVPAGSSLFPAEKHEVLSRWGHLLSVFLPTLNPEKLSAVPVELISKRL